LLELILSAPPLLDPCSTSSIPCSRQQLIDDKLLMVLHPPYSSSSTASKVSFSLLSLTRFEITKDAVRMILKIDDIVIVQ
jgi:hypothetical protein